MDPLDEIWDRLMWKHFAPAKDSVAALASLHAFVNEHRDETVVVGGGKLPRYPHSVLHLDVMIDYARRQNDVAFLRRYVRAVEFVVKGKHRALDATAQALVAWRQLRESLGKAPSPQEVKLQVEKEIGFKFTDRQWRRVFQDLAELFEPAG
jgi:hypothetical protein